MRISDWSSDVCSSDLAVDQRGDLDPRAHRAPSAPVLLAQRLEGAVRARRPPARRRVDPAGLVLCRHRRTGAGADHRCGLLPTHRRHRALAVSAGAQARRAPERRLALRLPPPACEVRQPGTLFRLLARPSPHPASAIAAGILPSPLSRSHSPPVALPFRSVAPLCTTPVLPVNHFFPSVPSLIFLSRFPLFSTPP